MFDRNLILKCLEKPYVVNSLSVSVQNSGKKRLILDLRVVNKHIWKQSVKYEDLKVVLAYIRKGYFMIKFDLTSAYNFNEIYKHHTKYLGFSGTDKLGNTFYYLSGPTIWPVECLICFYQGHEASYSKMERRWEICHNVS